MTNEELVKLYQEGDKEALDMLIEKNKGMVFKLVNKYFVDKTNSIDKEDLEQEGFIGLITAAKKYDFNNPKKAKFITYAFFWVNQKINRYISQKNTNDEISLNKPLGEDENLELLDLLEEKENQIIKAENEMYRLQLREEFERVMCSYTALREREVIKLRYGWDNNITMTLQEIGDILGVSARSVKFSADFGLEKIRKCPWGKAKALELYNQKKSEAEESIIGILESISFAQKYLYDESTYMTR